MATWFASWSIVPKQLLQITLFLRLFTALVMIARPKAFAFALRNLHGVVMLYMFLICSLQVIPPKALAIHPPLALRELIDYVYSNLDYVDNAHIGIAGYSKGGGNVIRVMTTLGDQQREDPDNYVRKVDAALILAPPFQPLDALATGINLGFGAGLYDPYSRIGFKPVEGYWPGDLSVKREMKETINLGVPGTFAEDELDDPNVKVEIGHVYGSFAENNARVVYNPADSTHGSGMISRGFMLIGIRYSVCDLYDIAQFFVYAVSPLLEHGYYKGINYICNANDRLSCSLIKDCAGIPVYAVDLNAGPKLNVYYLPHQQL